MFSLDPYLTQRIVLVIRVVISMRRRHHMFPFDSAVIFFLELVQIVLDRFVFQFFLHIIFFLNLLLVLIGVFYGRPYSSNGSQNSNNYQVNRLHKY